MIEIEIGEHLIAFYLESIKQDKRTLAVGTNLRDKNFDDCDLKLLEKYLIKKGYKMYFEYMNNHKFLFIKPNE